MAQTELKNGAIYHVNHDRKGAFTGQLLRHDDVWAMFEITSGTATAMMSYNVRYEGEEVTVRRSHCSFIPETT